MKPKDCLGVLEEICKKVASIYGYPIKKLDRKCHILVSADNGVIEEGVSSCPIEYTPIVSEAMLNNIACIGNIYKDFRCGIKCCWYRNEEWHKKRIS